MRKSARGGARLACVWTGCGSAGQGGDSSNCRDESERALTDLDEAVREIAAEMAARTVRGEVASYIPELAHVDVRAFGMAVVEADGRVVAAGDSEIPFSIQSIS